MKLPSKKVLAWIAMFIFVGIVLLYVLEFQAFGNTIGIAGLIKKSLFIGAVLGAGIGWYLHKKSDSKDAVEIMRRWLVCILVPVIFMPMLGSLGNRLLNVGEVQHQQVEFLEEKPFTSSPFGILEGEKVEPEGYYLFVFLDGKIERFESKKSKFPNAERGDKIQLKIRKGAFGYDFLAE